MIRAVIPTGEMKPRGSNILLYVDKIVLLVHISFSLKSAKNVKLSDSASQITPSALIFGNLDSGSKS